MGERNYKEKFEKYEKELEHINDLESLFQLWKKAQDIEIDELESKIEKLRSPERSDKEIFEKNIQKVRGKKNENTISSHFTQFFNKSNWKSVLKRAFNADGCVGTFDVKQEGYRYIFLLKEANDSEKTDEKCYDENPIRKECVNLCLQEWKNGKKTVRMLTRLYKAMAGAELPKEKSLELAAYMNVNKRGGEEKTQGTDESAVVRYAKKYRKFILREMYLLSKKRSVVVFTAGSYFPRLMKAIGVDEKNEYAYEGITIKFVKITHPSYPGIKKGQLEKEIESGKI